MVIGIATAQPASAAEPATWAVAGRQGIIQFVIVPLAQAHDQDAYAAQIGRLCEPGATCFINFYTNSTGAPLAVPVPDAIEHEPTAVFRRSIKQGAELFRWSCRVASGDGNCF